MMIIITMTEEKTYDYVLGLYEAGKLDTAGAIRQFRARNGRRWALVAAYWAAGALAAFAAVRYVAPRLGLFRPEAEETAAAPAPAAAVDASASEFVFTDAPLGTVLGVLSSYYGCVLETADTNRRLNGTFRKSDDVETVVSAIGEALGVDIEIVQ